MRGLAGILLVVFVVPANARNIDLSTLPPRDTVQLTIYNAEDLTLVRETRQLTFRKGVNPLQFSWANTLIDPTSVQIQFPKAADKLELLDTTYPHDKPEMLYWNVQSEIDGEATVQIRYFTSGLSWSADYVCMADPDETHMDLTGFVRVFNNSGEEYENAQVRLVVGSINLVEAVAELAKRRSGTAPLSSHELSLLVTNGALELDARYTPQALQNGGDVLSVSMGDFSQSLLLYSRKVPKKIEKESLGEYFIYTVEGTETIPNGWSKRLRSFEADDVPFDIQYRYRPAEYGDQLIRMSSNSISDPIPRSFTNG